MPKDSPSPSSPIPDRIAAALTEEIVRGDRKPGEKLAQDHIAQAFQTSHVPVREALLRLVARGLATNEPRRGVRVAPFSAADTREVVDMRIALEPLALRRAAPNMTAADLALAETAQQACDAATDAYDWEKQNRAFHLAILGPCRYAPASGRNRNAASSECPPLPCLMAILVGSTNRSGPSGDHGRAAAHGRRRGSFGAAPPS